MGQSYIPNKVVDGYPVIAGQQVRLFVQGLQAFVALPEPAQERPFHKWYGYDPDVSRIVEGILDRTDALWMHIAMQERGYDDTG